MKISLNWLRDFVDINIINKESLKKVVVGYVESIKKHPNADTLHIAEVNIGQKTVQIVCGGVNLKEKIYVPVALPGALLPGNFEIKVSKIRGEESHGMICAKEELKLGANKPRDIWILGETKKWKTGTPLLQGLNLTNSYSPEEIKLLLTHHTAEVEEIIYQGEKLNKVVTAKLLEYEKITGSDKLYRGIFDIGWKKIQIVFGSVHTVKVGEILPVALVGAKLPAGAIKIAEFKGVKSEGMVCGNDELGIGKKTLTRFAANTPLGKPIAEVLNLEDSVLVIDNKSLTHRPDLWGHYGIAREISAITGKKLTPSKTITSFPGQGQRLNIEVKDKTLCPRYIGVLIEGIKVEESPWWMQNRLITTGYRPINNIVDITNYVMAELGQPLHAFDADKIEKGIVVRSAKKNEKIRALDGKERLLDEDMLIIADHKAPVAIAGLIGGANSEINNKTTRLIIESANFNASSVRKTALKLGLRTEASARFEKSLDPHLADLAMDRICKLILQICPSARITSSKIDIKNFSEEKTVVHINLKKVFSKIGAEIPVKKVVQILDSLEFKTIVLAENHLKIEIPTFRATKDISIEDDIVEEIARIYGYENIEARLPNLPIKLPIANTERELKHRAREILALALGFNEVYNYSFYSFKDIKNSLLPEELHIKVQNYLSEDQTHLRVSLLPNMLKNTAANLKNFDNFKLFEIGRIYEDLQEYFPLEYKKICGLVAQKNITRAVLADTFLNNAEVFYQAKGALEAFLELMQVTELEMRKGEAFCGYAHPNRYASYFLNDEEIARVFELHPLVTRNFELGNCQIAAFEINFSRLVKIGAKTLKYQPIPKFPSISFDVSFVIDRNRSVADLQKIIKECDKKLIQKVKLFDIYEGAKIPVGKKSLAFQINLLAPDRTLADAEGQRVKEIIIATITKAGGQIRTA